MKSNYIKERLLPLHKKIDAVLGNANNAEILLVSGMMFMEAIENDIQKGKKIDAESEEIKKKFLLVLEEFLCAVLKGMEQYYESKNNPAFGEFVKELKDKGKL